METRASDVAIADGRAVSAEANGGALVLDLASRTMQPVYGEALGISGAEEAGVREVALAWVPSPWLRTGMEARAPDVAVSDIGTAAHSFPDARLWRRGRFSPSMGRRWGSAAPKRRVWEKFLSRGSHRHGFKPAWNLVCVNT